MSAAQSFTEDVIVPPADQPSKGTIVVVTYYGFRDPILTACESVRKTLGWNVVDFPMFRFRNDQHDKTPKFLDMFCDTVRRVKADAVLFWFHALERIELEAIRRQVDARVPLLVFNWDDPHCWREPNHPLPQLAPLFDGALTCCEGCAPKYIAAAESNTERREQLSVCAAQFCLPGYDTGLATGAMEQHAGENRFSCDVMFLTTNLYENAERYPHQRVNRAQLLDAIYARHEEGALTFHIYGPEWLAARFPNSYQGYLPYEKQCLTKRKARVVLTTHVVSDNLDGPYCNERLCVALGCGSLVLSDVLPKLNDTCDVDGAELVLDMGDSVESALEMLDSAIALPYEQAEQRREMVAATAAAHITWSHWAAQLGKLLDTLVLPGPDESAAQKLQRKFTRPSASEQRSTIQADNDTDQAAGGVADNDAGESVLMPLLMPGSWNRHDAAERLPSCVSRHVLGDGEEEELREQLRTTVLAPPHEFAQPMLGAARQRELSSIFDRLGTPHDDTEEERTACDSALLHLLEIMRKNKHLDVTAALDEHWRRTDAAP